MKSILLVLTSLAVLGCLIQQAASKHRQQEANCPKPYSHCNVGKEGYINVHIVPHTHDDVGWLKTVDQYYYGSNLGEQDARVQYILDTVVGELSKDPQKRFVYVEMAFFWRWWNEQNDETKEQVRLLVDEGRLEFVIGAWCMNDEATTYYQDIIDQQTLGLKFIQAEFGRCARPRAAWQIDPFGHSREQASLLAQFGFDALFLGRVDYQDKDYRTEKKTREMLWEASANLNGDTARLFTGILHNGYGPPDDFCFDQYCGDEPIMDDPNLDEYNVDKKVASFIRQTLEQADAYRTNNLVMTFGSDFQYSNAHLWFKNLDKAIYYINREQTRNGSRVNVFYSTTACYVNALHQANITWPTKSDDFFPYAHRPHSFWTGYFTSRPALKNMVRRVNNYLQVVRQLTAITDLSDQDTIDAIGVLERAMGVAQHHDAVSGTERQHVANDYAKRLANGMNKCLVVLNKALTGVVIDGRSHSDNLPFQHCPLVNISVCETSETQSRFHVFLYNPLARDISSHWIRVPVVAASQAVNYRITDEDGQTVSFDLAPVYQETQQIPERDNAKADHELVFKSDLPALGFRLYTVEKLAKSSSLGKLVGKKLPNVFSSPFVIENENLLAEFDGQGNLVQVKSKQFGLSSYVSQSYCVYKSMPGDNSNPDKQASGAYIFRPQNDTAECLKVSQYAVNKQSQFTEIHQVYNEWISQTIRLYAGATSLEFEWLVGPIDVTDKNGREIVVRFDSDLNSAATFYTDSNGREMLKRVVDYRPTWPLNQSEHVSGNYYPVNSRIFIRDEQQPSIDDSRQITLVTDRSQGGTSVRKGSVELMVHRRTLHDDSLGVSEPINEPGQDGKGLRAKGVINFILSDVLKSASLHRELAHRVNNQPLVLYGSEESSSSKLLEQLTNNRQLSGVITLPPNLHLLTLMRDFYDAEDGFLNSLIVRIEHFYEKNEDSLLSLPVTINLLDVFGKTFNVTNVLELTLGANMRIEELNERLDWQADSTYESNNNNQKVVFKPLKDTFDVQFEPMQIRTFRIWYLPKRQ